MPRNDRVRKEAWIVMEFCAARSLRDITRDLRRGLDDREMACALRQTLAALAYLHARRLVHRDIKSANLLMQTDGTLKLADFGVTAELTAAISRRHTMIGSPYWMSPEVIEDKGHDQKADIWSLGITAIELAELDPPHFDVPQMRVVFLIPSSPPPQLQHRERYAPALSDLIARCLTKDPDQRPSACDLLAHPYLVSAEHCVHALSPSDTAPADIVPCSLAALAREAATVASAGDERDAVEKSLSSSSSGSSSFAGSLELSSASSCASSVSSYSSSSYSSSTASDDDDDKEEKQQQEEGTQNVNGDAGNTLDMSLASLAQGLCLDGIPGLGTFPSPEAAQGAPRSPAECASCQALKQRVAELEQEISELTQQQLALVQECATYKGQIGILEQFASFAKK